MIDKIKLGKLFESKEEIGESIKKYYICEKNIILEMSEIINSMDPRICLVIAEEDNVGIPRLIKKFLGDGADKIFFQKLFAKMKNCKTILCDEVIYEDVNGYPCTESLQKCHAINKYEYDSPVSEEELSFLVHESALTKEAIELKHAWECLCDGKLVDESESMEVVMQTMIRQFGIRK